MTNPESTNGEHLKTVLVVIPDGLSEAEMSALMITVHTLRAQKPSAMLKSLIAASASYAVSKGLTNATVSELFTVAAQTYSSPTSTQKNSEVFTVTRHEKEQLS